MANYTKLTPCEKCGGLVNVMWNRVEHRDGCPYNPDREARNSGPESERPATLPSNVASITLARADKGSKPREHAPTDALDLARAWIEEAGAHPDHIIVMLGRTNSDNSSGTKYFQTGSFSAHAQVGLVYEALDLLRSGGKD